MKKRRNFSIYLLMLIGVFLLFANSCKKDDDNKNNDKANTFTDPRDGTVYKTVNIGNQVWMAENLKYLPGVAGPGTGSQTIPYYYVYGYDGTNIADAKATANYSTYGVLYNWEAAIAACPTGWHLPGDAEWTELTDYLGGSDISGGKLKETDTTHWNSPNEGASNETGFTALPGGFRDIGGTFYNVGGYGLWWSTSEYYSDYIWFRLLGYDFGDVGRIHGNKEVGFSVRCVRD